MGCLAEGEGEQGSGRADGVAIERFEADLRGNLYKLWNRMSSGSYFPGPVRAVEIPKKGGTRILGIPALRSGVWPGRAGIFPAGRSLRGEASGILQCGVYADVGDVLAVIKRGARLPSGPAAVGFDTGAGQGRFSAGGIACLIASAVFDG